MFRLWLARLWLVVVVLTLALSAAAQTGKDVTAPIVELPSIPVTLPDVTAYEGRTVVAVRAKMEGMLWPTPPKLAAPKVGTPFSLVAARAELLRLLEGGGFAGGSLEIEPGIGGVEVVFRLQPSRLVRRVVFKGNELGDDVVRRAGGFVDVREVTEKSLDEASKKIRAYYVQRGFPKAKVDIATIETDLQNVVLVQITVESGKPTTVQKRVFAGLPTWDTLAVAAAESYSVKADERVDEDALDLADRALANSLRAVGFPTATVTHGVTPGEGSSAVLTVNVVPGPKVVLSFEGNVLFDREGLLDILDLKNEADRSPLRLASKIEAAYRKLGYLDVLVETELLGNPTDAQRALRIRIREGDAVTVVRRVYPCLTGALTASRLDEEIDSFLDEELAGEGFGDASQKPIDETFKGGDVSSGTHPMPAHPSSRSVFFAETYEHARDHLVELYRSEGYMFVEIGEIGVLRGACAKGSMPGSKGCKPVLPGNYDEKKLCTFDNNRLPLPIPPIEKKLACQPDPLKGIECAPTLTVVLPINPGPRSFLWDVSFDGTHAIAPATLGGSAVAGSILRMGDPLSLKDIEAARKAVVEYYRDEGYYFVNVKVTFDYSSDKSRARVRFIVSEGEQVVIDKIFVEGERNTRESLIRARLRIEEGGIYRARLVRESQDRLVKLGVFSSVSIGLVNANIPGKRKSVIVNVVERPRQLFDYRIGFAIAEGIRFRGDYSYGNFLGYALSLNLGLKFSWQNFLLCPERGACPFYDPVIVQRWTDREQVSGLDRLPRRISVGLTAPHTPLLGSAVRTSLEFVTMLDLRRDFLLNKYLLPVLTLTYTPVQPLTVVFSGDMELNKFKAFENGSSQSIANANPALAPLLRVPDGNTSVTALSSTFTLDFRDNRLGATKNGFVSLTSEWVRSNNLWTPPEAAKQDFLHLTGGGAMYFKLPVPKHPILALLLFSGVNVNVGRCFREGDVNKCDTYPDRLFYLGGVESNRGFFPGTMLPQDSIDELSVNKDALLGSVACSEYPVDPLNPANHLSVNAAGARSNTCGASLANSASRGGNVYINPRVELRIPAFKWGGFIIFVDATNTWRYVSNFRPWILRYSVGPGLSVDTPVGPVAFDFGFNLSRYTAFNEPFVVFNFSIGRF